MRLPIASLIALFLVSAAVLYQNCDGGFEQSNGPSSTAIINNYFSRPSVICGKVGFEYLNRRFYNPHCAECHADNGLATPYFGSNNPDFAFQEMLKAVALPTFLDKSVNNGFCGQSCRLLPTDPIYKDIQEWMKNPATCP